KEILDVVGHGGIIPFLQAGKTTVDVDLTAVVGRTPHAREEMGGRRIAPVGGIFSARYLVAMRSFDHEVAIRDGRRLVLEIGTVEDGPVAILVAAEIAYEIDGIVHIIHIHGDVGIGPDHRGEICGVAEEHKGEAPQPDLQIIFVLPDSPADTEHEGGGQREEEEGEAREKGQVELVDEEDIEIGGALDGILDHEFLHESGDGAADDEGDEAAPEGRLIPFKIVNHHDGGDGQQVEKVDADGQPHHIKDKDDPAVGVRFIGIVLPFEDGPENEGGEEGGGGIDLTLYGAIPIRIAKGAGHGADHAGGHDQKCLKLIRLPVRVGTHHELTGEMGGDPEQEEDRDTAGECAEKVDAMRSGMRVITKEDDEEAAHKGE